MRVLFVHQNFPAQFKFVAPALAADKSVDVSAMTMGAPNPSSPIRLWNYGAQRGSTPNIHPWLQDMESKVIRGEAALRAALQMRQQGYRPDIIVAHPGWGESLFLKDVWPDAKLGLYCEFFYHASGADVGFDPEFAEDAVTVAAKMRVKNAHNLVQLETADAGIAPTHWQASTFPEPFRSRITVVHDGIDTNLVKPNPAAGMTLNQSLKLSRDDEIITFVNRDLEPYRGYHRLMRALPEIMARSPKARIVIVGGDGVSYGKAPPDGTTWKRKFLEEVAARVDLSRIHFVGQVGYAHYLTLLQMSTVHVYLTYPFVLGWSALESMSAGCAIVASDTAPLREVITDGQNGCLVDFFDTAGLAGTVCDLLADPERRRYLGEQARAFAVNNYDLNTVCLPRQLAWVRALA